MSPSTLDPTFANSALETLADDLDHPEAVCWSPFHDGVIAGGEAGQLYLLPLDPGAEKRELTTIAGASILGIAVDAVGRIYACDPRQSAVHCLEPSGELRIVASIDYPNYLAFDASGSLWVSDSGAWESSTGALWKLSQSHSPLRLELRPLAFANGIAISGRRLFLVESAAARVVEMDLDDPRSLTTVVELPATVPDGLVFDVEGGLWISCFQPNRIFRLDPNGRLEVMLDDWSGEEILSPTNVCFAGPGGDQLVIASLGGRSIRGLHTRYRGAPLELPREPLTQL